MHHYHNSVDTKGDLLTQYEDKAVSQEMQIVAWFLVASPTFTASPSVVHDCVFLDDVPLTSVRRAMSNLSRDGWLVKTDKKVKGKYGRLEHSWRLVEKSPQQDLF